MSVPNGYLWLRAARHQASVTGTQYLHDLSVHRIESYAGLTLRLFRGLEFTLYGNFYRIKDQFGLPARRAGSRIASRPLPWQRQRSYRRARAASTAQR